MIKAFAQCKYIPKDFPSFSNQIWPIELVSVILQKWTRNQCSPVWVIGLWTVWMIFCGCRTTVWMTCLTPAAGVACNVAGCRTCLSVPANTVLMIPPWLVATTCPAGRLTAGATMRFIIFLTTGWGVATGIAGWVVAFPITSYNRHIRRFIPRKE